MNNQHPKKALNKKSPPSTEPEALSVVKKHLHHSELTPRELQNRSKQESDKCKSFSLNALHENWRETGNLIKFEKNRHGSEKLVINNSFPLSPKTLEQVFNEKKLVEFSSRGETLLLPQDYIADHINASQYPHLTVFLQSAVREFHTPLRERSQGVNLAIQIDKTCSELTSSEMKKETLKKGMLLMTTHLFLTSVLQRFQVELARFCNQKNLHFSELSESSIHFSPILDQKNHLHQNGVQCSIKYTTACYGSWLDTKPEGADHPRLKESLELLNIPPSLTYEIFVHCFLKVNEKNQLKFENISYQIELYFCQAA